MLYKKDILLGPLTLYRIMRDYLDSKGFEYTQSATASSSYNGLAHCFFDDDDKEHALHIISTCLLYTSPSPRDQRGSRMPSSA